MYRTDLLVVPALLFIYRSLRLRRCLRSPLIGPPVILLTLLLLASAGYSLWYFHRPDPARERRQLAPGITFIREIRKSPRPLVIHIFEIDLDQTGLEFLVTPSEPIDGHQLRARSTSQFVRELPVQIAINASFFHPWHSSGPFDYYPLAGDPCNASGECVSHGSPYSKPEKGFHLMVITKEN